jgi:phage terminase large subunit
MFAGLRHNVESIKSMEGIDILDVEEAVDVSKDSWEKVLPTIRKDAPGGPFAQGSEIWVSFNPELETDETYQRFVVHPPTGAVVVHLTWRDNPWFPKILQQQMEDMRTRDPDAYLNIWEGHCRQWLDGAIFANEIRAATEESRITNVPYRQGVPVSVFCDLGYSDYTALWFVQKVGMNYHVIDFHQDQFKFWPHYLGVLQSRGYVYDSIWLPHDGGNKNIALVDASKTVEGQTKAVGYRVKEVPNISVADGLNAARTMFPAIYFDQTKCADGLNSLRRYRYQISKEGQFSREPKHDDASHAADAFRYLAVGTRDGSKTVKVSIPTRHASPNNSSSWMT